MERRTPTYCKCVRSKTTRPGRGVPKGKEEVDNAGKQRKEHPGSRKDRKASYPHRIWSLSQSFLLRPYWNGKFCWGTRNQKSSAMLWVPLEADSETDVGTIVYLDIKEKHLWEPERQKLQAAASWFHYGEISQLTESSQFRVTLVLSATKGGKWRTHIAWTI